MIQSLLEKKTVAYWLGICLLVCLFFMVACSSQKPTAQNSESIAAATRVLEYNATIIEDAVQVFNNSGKGIVAGTLENGDRILVRSQSGDMCSVTTGDQSGWVECQQIKTDDAVTVKALPTNPPLPTSTRRPTPVPFRASSYKAIDIRELESYADEHIGERVRVRGEVFNILDGAYQVWVDKGNYDVVSILVGFDEDTDMRVGRIYEDDVITVYGMVLGEVDGTNSFGSSISNALVFAERIEK